jgi:hypothetical protein
MPFDVVDKMAERAKDGRLIGPVFDMIVDAVGQREEVAVIGVDLRDMHQILI